MSRYFPAVYRDAQIVAFLRTTDARAETVGQAMGLSTESAWAYLRTLEAQGAIVARLETMDEAKARAQKTPRSAFKRVIARRQIVYGLKVAA